MTTSTGANRARARSIRSFPCPTMPPSPLLKGVPYRTAGEMWSADARDLVRLDALRADRDAPGPPPDGHPDLLHVRVPSPPRPSVGVGDVVTELRFLATDLAYGGHRRRVPNALVPPRPSLSWQGWLKPA